MTFPFPFAPFPDTVVPGSQSLQTPGTFIFTVPDYNTLTVTVRGGGAEGWTTLNPGSDGGASSFNGNVIANGGLHSADGSAGGFGGTASGGDENYPGGSGGATQALIGASGGGGANGGGAGGVGTKANGNVPGGGGAGDVAFGVGFAGGGGGGCAAKTYQPGQLSVGAQITVSYAGDWVTRLIRRRGEPAFW